MKNKSIYQSLWFKSTSSHDNKLVSNSGFATLWYDQTEEAFFKHTHIHHKGYQISNIRQPFSLHDIQAPFYILIIGYIISFVVFLTEKFVLHPKKCEKLQRIIRPVNSVRSDFQLSRVKKCKKFSGNQKRSLQWRTCSIMDINQSIIKNNFNFKTYIVC